MRRAILGFTPPGNVRLVCDIAETPEQIAKGLGGRAGLGPSEGMIFLMPLKVNRFWMKGVSFSLDLLFFGAEATLLDAIEWVPPGPPFVLWGISEPSKWVIEAPAGWVKRVGVQIGCRLSTAGWVKENG